MSNIGKIKNKIFVIFIIILFCLFTFPSSSSSDDINNLFSSGKYKIVLIALPQFMHNPESWNTVHSDVSTITSFLEDSSIEKFIKKNSLTHKSISEVAETYDAFVYINSPNFAYSKIILPEENYEGLTETFRSLGFEVRDDIPIEPTLDESKDAIGLPYVYETSNGESELTGWGSVIAIIDSGIDPDRLDFQTPTIWDKVDFWNDTTSEYHLYGNPVCYNNNPGHEEDCIVDDFGHGTFIASVAAGREGDCSDPPYPCSHWSGDNNGDGVIDQKDMNRCFNAGCDDWTGYPEYQCIGEPDPCDNWDGYKYTCEYFGCTWSENPFKGVAPHAKLKVWKTSIQIDPETPKFEAKWMAEAVSQATEYGADVISISCAASVPATADMCTGNYYGQYSEDYYEWYLAIMNAINNGITVVATAGNEGPFNETIGFPGCINEVIAVGNTLKKNYDCIGGYFGWMCEWDISYEPVDTNIDFYIILTENGEDTIWDAGWGWGGSRNGWSGQQIVFQPSDWPATIKVKVEGKNRDGDCLGENEPKWDPGSSSEASGPYDDGEFWIWSYTFSSGPYIVVELFNLPITDSGFCWWHNYYTQDRIFVNAYRTDSISTKGLVVPQSSRGLSPQGTLKPDVTAPGHDICAARISDSSILENKYGCTLSCSNNNYIMCSGTSASVPHVSGLVALLKDAKQDSTVDEIRTALRRADNKVIIPTNPDYIEGYGKINVQKAIDYTCYRSIVLNLPSKVSPGEHVTAIVSNENCDFPVIAEIRRGSCSGQLICWCEIKDNSGCTCDFYAPESSRTYTYHACIRGSSRASKNMKVENPSSSPPGGSCWKCKAMAW